MRLTRSVELEEYGLSSGHLIVVFRGKVKDLSADGGGGNDGGSK